MSTVEKLEVEILKLSDQEFSQLANWLIALDEQRWDEQIAKDAAAGKLNFLATEAIGEHGAGETYAL
ncbi:MAG: hypothetical protein AAFQ63_03895 [Cyanobacteria bacterium J06621_11]